MRKEKVNEAIKSRSILNYCETLTENKEQEQRMPSLSIVIPCYNEDENIRELYRRLTATCHSEIVDKDYEIVFINDGSTDRTWEKILDLVKLDARIVGIKLSRNYGHQKALSAGMKICKGERILIIDADLQDPPELLPEMMGLMDTGADVVYGQRAIRQGESWFKLHSAAIFYRLLGTLAEVNIPFDTGDFRMMSRRALDIINAMPEQHRFIRGMVSWIGLKQEPLIYNREKRFSGQTKYPIKKMARFAIDAITGFSVIPLKLASYLGILFGFLGSLAIIYTLYSWMSGSAVLGWTSIMSVVLVLGSVQLFVLGIFGEYLGRLFIEAKGRPLFIIDEIVGSSY